MKKLIAIVCAGLFSGVFADTILYVKPGGTGEGTSWSDAAGLEAAVAAARDGASVTTIYAAKGLYTLTATLSLNSNVAIYGGFAGESTGETPETRDLKANPTILSGDVNGDDVWVRYYPLTGTSEVTTEPIVKDGQINELTFANEYDTCAPDSAKVSSDNLGQLVTVLEGTASTCLIDGLTFTGGGRGYNGTHHTILNVEKNATPIVRNNRFVGCYGNQYGIYFNNSAPTFVNNSIEFCQCEYYAVLGGSSSTAVVKDCSFIGNVRKPQFNSVGAAAVNMDRGLAIEGCVFKRNYNYHSRTGCKSEAAAVCCLTYSSCKIKDCTFENNSVYDTTGLSTPIVLLNYFYYNRVVGCTFVRNNTIVSTSAAEILAAGAVFTHYGTVALDSCSFLTNNVSVTASSDATIRAATVLQDKTGNLHVVNGTFSGNHAAVAASETSDVIFARGVLQDGTSGYTAIMNCTFEGCSAGPDVVSKQTVAGSYGLFVLNSAFWATGEAVQTPRLVGGETSPSEVHCSIVANPGILSGDMILDDVWGEDPLMSTVKTLEAGRPPVVQLGARLPYVHDTFDIALNQDSKYQFRENSAAQWTSCMGSVKNSYSMISDAIGATRTEGNITIGAAQALTDKAENGLTVVYRMDPAGVARLDGKKTQVVDVGETTEAVMGVSTDESYSFRRWRDETGETFSEDNPVTVTAEAAGTLVLTAQFNPAAVDYTFDLGPYATFDDDGSTNKVLTLVPDSIVEIPAYTICDGFSFKAWTPEVPAVVGTLDATFALQVYRRDTYLQPGDDIAAAIAEAKLYAGDGDVVVHLAAGEYTISEAIVLPSKVKLLGEAGATMKRTNISGNNCWTIANPSTGADIDTGTINIEGIAFLGGGVATGLSRGRIVDCVFTNCHNGINGAVSFHIDATKAVTNSVSLVNCGFYRCTSALRGWGNGGCGETAYVTNCVFYGNDNTFDSHNGTPLGAAVALSGNAGKFYGCRFEKNSSSNPASDYGIIAGGALSFDRCQIVDNVCTGDYNIIRKATYSDITFTHTLFLNNRVVGDRYSTGYAKYANQPTGIVVEGAMGSPSYVNCAFVSNVVDRTEAASYEGVTTVPCHIVYGNRVSTMRYCFFEGNVVRATSSVAGTKPVCSVYSAYAEIESSIEGCTFHDNMASDGAIYMREERNLSGVIQPLWIWNSIFSGSDAEAAPVRYAGENLTVGVHLRHCVAPVQDDVRVIRDDTCKTGPVAFAAKTEEIDGLVIRPVADAAAARTKPVKWYFTTNGKKMYYNEGLKAYRRLNGDCWDSYMTQYTPYTTVADMFGEVPEGGKALAGAYQNHVKKGLMLLLR